METELILQKQSDMFNGENIEINESIYDRNIRLYNLYLNNKMTIGELAKNNGMQVTGMADIINQTAALVRNDSSNCCTSVRKKITKLIYNDSLGKEILGNLIKNGNLNSLDTTICELVLKNESITQIANKNKITINAVRQRLGKILRRIEKKFNKCSVVKEEPDIHEEDDEKNIKNQIKDMQDKLNILVNAISTNKTVALEKQKIYIKYNSLKELYRDIIENKLGIYMKENAGYFYTTNESCKSSSINYHEKRLIEGRLYKVI